MRTALAMILVGLAGLGAGVSVANASRVVVGGIYLDADLINATNSTQFRSYPNTGLYIHNGGTISGIEYGWLSLDPDAEGADDRGVGDEWAAVVGIGL